MRPFRIALLARPLLREEERRLDVRPMWNATLITNRKDLPMDETDVFAEWVILELMGHRRLAGFLTEQEIAGRGFLRLEIPTDPPMSQMYNPSSVYCITPTTADTATAVARQSQPAPVQRWELPAVPTMTPQDAHAAAGFPDDEGPF